MNTIQERIIKYLEFKDISKYKFYQTTGLSNGFLDKSGSMGSEKCEIIISHYPDLNLEWAITGKGEMIKQENEKKAVKNGIPIIPIDAMAGMGNGDMPVLTTDCEYWYVSDFNKKADFGIRISGTSMSPKYHSGDVLACKKVPLKTFIQWGKVYVMDTVQGAICKRLFPSEKGDEYVRAQSENPKYPPFDMLRKEIRGLAIVVGVIRLE